MKNLFKVLRFARKYRGAAFLNILFNLFSILFSFFSLAMIVPFLNLIFNQDMDTSKNSESADEPSMKDRFLDPLYNYFQEIIDAEGQAGALVYLCIGIVLVILGKNIFRYLAMLAISRVRAGVVKDLRAAVYRKITRLQLSYYSDERKGDIIARMTTDVQEVEWSILTGLEMIFRDPPTIIFFLGTMLIMSPSLTLFILILLPITGLLIGRIGKSLKRTSDKVQSRMGLLMSLIEETVGGLRIIQAFNAEKAVGDRFDKENEAYRGLMVKMYNKRDLSSPLSEFMGVSVMTAVIWFGGNMILDDQTALDGSQFILYVILFTQMITPAKAITTAYYNVQKGGASVDRIEQLLNAEETITSKPEARELKGFNDKIEYRNVDFRYQTDLVLNQVNLTVKKGEMIALVGPSGGGKSTLADLLPRFHDPVAGEVCIDGTTLRDCEVSSVRSLMGIVTQQSILFNDTVAKNIALGMENVERADIESAAKVANAHDFIMGLPNGYDTNIGDSGGKLSGGQRQRLSIARAVLKNPPILILDEATSALDTESEKLVQDALNKLMQNRTSLVIAHRLSTIQNASRILVIQEGKVVEEGSHDDLLLKKGVYKKLYDLQSFA